MNVDVDITKVDGAKFVEAYCLGIINSANELRRILLHRPEEKTWQDKNKFVCVSTPSSEKTWQDEIERLDKEKALGIQPTASAKTWSEELLERINKKKLWEAVEKRNPTADKDVMPRKAWNEARINDLRTAIRCALDAGREIPAEWVYEINDLLAEVDA